MSAQSTTGQRLGHLAKVAARRIVAVNALWIFGPYLYDVGQILGHAIAGR